MKKVENTGHAECMLVTFVILQGAGHTCFFNKFGEQ